jgi:hypothetical protein
MYADASNAYATAKTRSDLSPDDHALYRSMMDAYVARDNVWSRFLAKLHELEDAGAPIVADNMRSSASRNASLAESIAIKEALDTLKGAA